MLVVFDEGGSGAGRFRVWDGSCEHSYDWSRGGGRAAIRAAPVVEIGYTYDMGDDWRHSITVETVGPGEPDVKYPRFVDGERRCPPEDVGGLPGFEMFLDAVLALPAVQPDRSAIGP